MEKLLDLILENNEIQEKIEQNFSSEIKSENFQQFFKNVFMTSSEELNKYSQ